MARLTRIIIAAAAAAAFLLGMYRGEVSEVFEKAANICLECIGFG